MTLNNVAADFSYCTQVDLCMSSVVSPMINKTNKYDNGCIHVEIYAQRIGIVHCCYAVGMLSMKVVRCGKLENRHDCIQTAGGVQLVF